VSAPRTYGTSFVGREPEQTELVQLIDRHPLVTVVGAGGAGKTRLAIHVVERVADTDEVWFVDLGSVRDPELVATAVLIAVGQQSFYADAASALVAHLRGRRGILMLDSCEHVVGAAAAVVTHVVRTCPHVRVLATSRTTLGVEGEAVMRLGPLPLGDGADAFRLFVERAVAARGSFHVTEKNRSAVVNVVGGVDGLPLAIELAAARVAALSVEQIQERLVDRVGLLSSTASDVPLRQRTLRALLDWSYALLSEPARILLGRASVFSGGCTVRAVEDVCSGGAVERAGVLDALVELIDASLLGAREVDGVVRYESLHTIRDFAREKLDAAEDSLWWRHQHLVWCRSFAKEAAAALIRADAERWLKRLDLDEANLREALDFCVEQGLGPEAFELVGDLWRYWHVRGRLDEGRVWMNRTLALSTPDRSAEARALNAAANLDLLKRDFDSALGRYERALAIRRDIDDRAGILTTVNDLGTLFLHMGDAIAARPYLEESLELAGILGDPWAAAAARTNLAEVCSLLGELRPARTHSEAALELWAKVGYREGEAITKANLTDVCRQLGDLAQARAYFDDAVATIVELGHEPLLMASLRNGIALERDDGSPVRAATILGLTEAMGERLGIPLSDPEAAGIAEARAELVTLLGPTSFDDAVARGRSLDRQSAIAFALRHEEVVAADPVHYVFKREADIWTISYEGAVVRLRDAKGLSYLATLLASPGREFHCAELLPVAPQNTSHAGEILDAQARDDYRRRLADLQSDLEEATDWHDPERVARIQAEIDALVEQLSAAFGLGGRARKGADEAERIRKAVTNRIKASIAKIRVENGELGQHLANAVRTGLFCSYVPDKAVRWSTK
jgi:non-specific serine/threonine protein kinase